MNLLLLPSGGSARARIVPDWVRSRQRIASLGFVLLFPGFLIYHYGISTGWWGEHLGGMFAGATILIAALSMVSLVRHLCVPRRMSALQVLFLAIMVLMAMWTLGHIPFLPQHNLQGAIVVESIATITIWVAVIFIGSWFPTDDLRIARIDTIGMSLVLLAFTHAFYEKGFPGGPFLAFVQLDVTGLDTGVSKYQGVGRSLLAISVVAAIARQPYKLRSVLVLLMSTMLMLALGSRAHFFVLSLVLSLHILILVNRPETRSLGVASLVLILITAVLSSTIFLESRAAEVLDLVSSSSWRERSISNAHAVDIILEHPLLGDFGYHNWGQAGYAHNLLSAWTQYGFFGFALFVLTLLAGFAASLSGYRRHKENEPAWLLAIYLNFIAIVLAIFSEPIMSSVFPALAWGFALRATRLARSNHKGAR